MTLWLIKLILAHLLTDFLLQRKSWIRERRLRHFQSPYLYVHTLLTTLVAGLLIGWSYWPTLLVILITHALIDGWKSYRPETSFYFLADQALHFLVILACWVANFYSVEELGWFWKELMGNTHFWAYLTGFLFLTWPSSILVGQLTRSWRDHLDQSEALAHAGMWIGMMERCLILIMVLAGQYEAMGLLIAAKGFIRFNEKNRPERKTEYFLIGTLISIGLAVLTGLLLQWV